MNLARTLTRRALASCVLLAVAVACAGLTGCDQAPKKADSSKKEFGLVTDKKPGENPAASATPIEVQTVSKEGFEKLVASHKGKVVLVDFWATWCGPCVAQFPHTVDLANMYKDKGLVVISVSVDEPEELPAVAKFLIEKGADFQNVITEYGMKAIDEFDVDNGGVPCYWIYNREGKRVERISPGDPTKKFSPHQIDDAVIRLLAEAAPTADAPAAEPSADTPAAEAAAEESAKEAPAAAPE